MHPVLMNSVLKSGNICGTFTYCVTQEREGVKDLLRFIRKFLVFRAFRGKVEGGRG